MARPVPEINGGSMADIAFLLLIFFIVSSTMDIDTGLYRILPPLPEEETVDDNVKIKERNIFVVLVNKNNELYVENDVISIDQLRNKAVEFLTNPNNSEKLPEKTLKVIDPLGEIMVSKGIISLQNDNGTNYETYVKVLNELLAAGNQVRNDFSIARFGKKFDELGEKKQDAVRDAVPVVISEAEPRNIGGD